MSYIDSQIRELREIAEMYEEMDGGELLKECADTIESLYKKLNEKSNGDWIPCNERLPKKSNSYLVTKHIDETEDNEAMSEVCTEIFWTTDNKWDCERDSYCEWKVTAWQPMPESYHE